MRYKRTLERRAHALLRRPNCRPFDRDLRAGAASGSVSSRPVPALEQHQIAQRHSRRGVDEDTAIRGHHRAERQREVAYPSIEEKLFPLVSSLERRRVRLARRVVVIRAAFDGILVGRTRHDLHLIPGDGSLERGILQRLHIDAAGRHARARIPLRDQPPAEPYPHVDGLFLGRVEVDDRRFHPNGGRHPALDVGRQAINEAWQVARTLWRHPFFGKAVLTGH